VPPLSCFYQFTLTPIYLCGLWEGPIRTLAKSRGPPKGAEQNPDEPRELQLVLDPELLINDQPSGYDNGASVDACQLFQRPGNNKY